jgi:(p)ppGpp synthase/HD superfamily hydrolase
MNDMNKNISIEDLIDRVKSYNNDANDIDLINRAFDYAYKKHFGVKRITGDDYISHPLNVAYILTDINADAACLAAALLHEKGVSLHLPG